MSTLLIAAVLIAAIIAIVVFLISIDKKQKQNAMNTFFNCLSKTGSLNKLNFTSQEFLNNIAIGLDAPQRKLLILTRVDRDVYRDRIINLDHVQCCSVKKNYDYINAGDLKTNRLEKHLEEIVLHMNLYDGSSADIPFYSHINDHISRVIETEEKAKRWEAIISSLLNDRFKKNNLKVV
ncbi:hypothetical protein FW778_14630 [Ginsengibacter hankyongi]|uniref:Uncharacterized protein n=1 Tax=Ginsengibacter hankyongi TaxID=2607284 RepID=A0A5J5IFQ2_9BACT|nr:hypothetical protein [Ginsengibacter hankyongi]KAA9038000.1 hypothetical protein FW778_14630 [Ginsengibacter hankyongi]